VEKGGGEKIPGIFSERVMTVQKSLDKGKALGVRLRQEISHNGADV